MPPVHPALVHFPIALVALSFFADLLGYIGGSSSFRAAGWWALAAAAIGAALAVPAGLFDMYREKIGHDAHHRVHRHMKVGFALFAAILGLTVWRWSIYTAARGGPGRGYLLVAFFVFALALFQGWLGGELVFSDGVGVASTGQGTRAPAERSSMRKRHTGDSTGAHSGGH